ncbi:MAG: hypothetical protein IJZ89_04360 [Clostridia bacterium]|nr:hypothetical protein [Clostridia bacterium]
MALISYVFSNIFLFYGGASAMRSFSLFQSARKSFIFLLLLALAVFLFASCSGESGERISEIKSVKYDKENAQINISATLDSADVREFRGETVYLIEVPANSSISDIVTLIPVAQSRSGAEMSFSLPLKDGARTMLYSGFVLAVFDQTNGYIPLCQVRYLDNPDALAANSASYPIYSSIKGLSIVSSSDAVALGARHTVIRIPIEDYLLSESTEGALSYVFDGNPYYYSASKISELDYKIKNLTGAGMEIFLEFTLDTPREGLPAALANLASKSAFVGSEEEENTSEDDGKHYAVSVTNGESYRYMAAFFEMLAERYTRSDGKYGFAAAYIIGNGVNSAEDDPRTLSDSASRYAKLLRIASSALRSKYAEGKVLVSLDNKWTVPDAAEENTDIPNPAAPISQRLNFGGAEYLTALENEIEKGGIIEYGIALMPNASDNSSAVWNDAGALDSGKTEYLTVKNLSIARDHIGEDKEIIIYNYGISAEDTISMAASYAYAYLKAAEIGASAFIYNGQWDDSTGNGKTGLWSTDEGGIASEKREIYEVFKNIDVKDALLPELVSNRIGSEWSVLYEKYGKEIKSAEVTSSIGSTVKNENDRALKKAEDIYIFDFSQGKSFDFFPSDSAAYVEIANYLGVSALKSGLQPKYKGENIGVRSSPIPFETLENALQITAVLSADPGEGNTALLTLGLSQNGEKGSLFHTSTVSVQASNRQTVYFDISEAGLDKDLGDVTLYLWVRSEAERSPVYSGGEAEEQLLYIESFKASVRKSGNGIIWTVIVVILLIIILAVLYLLFLYSPKPKNTRYNAPVRGGRPMQGQRPSGSQRPYPPQRTNGRPNQRPMNRQPNPQRPRHTGGSANQSYRGQMPPRPPQNR